MRTSLPRRAAAGTGAALVVAGTLLATGGVAQAAFAGYNGLIAFSSTRANLAQDTTGGNLWQVNPVKVMATGASAPTDVAATTELTASKADDQAPFYSPDGTKVVFFSNRGSGGNEQLFEVAAGNVPVAEDPGTGAEPVGTPEADGAVRLLADTANDTWPSWSPDGHTIAFLSGSSTTLATSVEVLDTAVPGATPTVVYSVGSKSASQIALSRPVFDPKDPSKLVFTSSIGDLILLSGVGTPTVTQTDLSAATGVGSAIDEHPDWSPDGTTLIFDSTRGEPTCSGSQLYTVNVAAAVAAAAGGPAASASAVFTACSTYNGQPTSTTQPVYSPDGSAIAFTQSQGGLDVGDFAITPQGKQANPNNVVDLTLAPTNPSDSQPDWQPSSTPPPGLPESPLAVGLPVAGLVLIGGAVLAGRRRRA